MALPPQHITIKRRRDDEPVDTLCKCLMLQSHIASRFLNFWSDIQQKRQRADYLWCRVDSGETSTKGIISLPNPLPPSTSLGAPRNDDARARVPEVRATSPIKDKANERCSSPGPPPYQEKHAHNIILEPHAKTVAHEPSPLSSVVQTGLKRRHSSKHLFRHRTFHLSSKLASSSTPVAPLSGTPNLKRHRKDLAVFMERTKRVLQAQDTLRRTTIVNTRLAQIGDDTQKGDDHEPGSRQLPSAINEEARIGSSIKPADTVFNPSTRAQDFKKSSGGSDLDASIAEQLHQIAHHQSLISTHSPGARLHEPQPKIKPKPPKPRAQKKQIESADSSGEDVADIMIGLENEDDFVYDTYVRSSGQLAGIPTDISGQYNGESHHVDSNRIGILIIPEQDQALWEKFGEEEESDRDWNSEEEDENGTCLPRRGAMYDLPEVANETKRRTFMAMTIRKTKSILMTSLAWALTTIDTVLQTTKNLMKLRRGRMKRVRHNIHGNAVVGGFACRILRTTKIGIIESKTYHDK